MDKKNFTLFSELKESNGKTVKENNLSKKHNIPLGSLVKVNVTLHLKTNSQLEGEVLLYVTHHGRDCDGTPLYGLCDIPVVYPEKGFDKHWMQVKAFYNFMQFGYSEENLFPIDKVEKLYDSVGEFLKI